MFISPISEYQISNVQCFEYPISNQLYVLNVQCFECPISNQLYGAGIWWRTESLHVSDIGCGVNPAKWQHTELISITTNKNLSMRLSNVAVYQQTWITEARRCFSYESTSSTLSHS